MSRVDRTPEADIYNHLYAIWSADDMDNGEFEYRYRQVLEACARHRQAAVDELLDELERELPYYKPQYGPMSENGDYPPEEYENGGYNQAIEQFKQLLAAKRERKQ